MWFDLLSQKLRHIELRLDKITSFAPSMVIWMHTVSYSKLHIYIYCDHSKRWPPLTSSNNLEKTFNFKILRTIFPNDCLESIDDFWGSDSSNSSFATLIDILIWMFPNTLDRFSKNKILNDFFTFSDEKQFDLRNVVATFLDWLSFSITSKILKSFHNAFRLFASHFFISFSKTANKLFCCHVWFSVLLLQCIWSLGWSSAYKFTWISHKHWIFNVSPRTFSQGKWNEHCFEYRPVRIVRRLSFPSIWTLYFGKWRLNCWTPPMLDRFHGLFRFGHWFLTWL